MKTSVNVEFTYNQFHNALEYFIQSEKVIDESVIWVEYKAIKNKAPMNVPTRLNMQEHEQLSSNYKVGKAFV